MAAHRPSEATYLTALDAALTGARRGRGKAAATRSASPGAPGTPGKPARA